jgi:uncharacterized membrane protein
VLALLGVSKGVLTPFASLTPLGFRYLEPIAFAMLVIYIIFLFFSL